MLLKWLKSQWWKLSLSAVILVALILCFYSVRLYFKEFGTSTSSHEPQNWGEFGDYFSGTLNTLFSLINVCITIWLTVTINRFSSKNTDKQIEAERKISTIQLRHEALRELRIKLDTSFAVWKTDVYLLKLANDCHEPLTDFTSNYSYLFDDETFDLCFDLNSKINEVAIAIKEKQTNVQQLYNSLYPEVYNLYASIGRKIIQ